MADIKPIVKTFKVQQSPDSPATLYARTDSRWGTFQNQYAVWPSLGNEVASYTIIRTFVAPYSGKYYFKSSVDNSASVYVDGAAVGGTVQFNQNPSSVPVSLSAGTHQLKFVVSNAGDVAGFALTISNTSNVVIWDTRTYASIPPQTIARYALTMPFRANITTYLWGAGGGGGGMDAGTSGGYGAPGLYNAHTIEVNSGDVLEVIVGDRGAGGPSNTGGYGLQSAPGASGTNISNNPAFSFNGGYGSGPGPSSGAGGGGGGATVVLINGVPVVVAGGGAGGGGAGNDGNGLDNTTRRNATLISNATGLPALDYRGENGQTRSTDGGGSGGGGGGYPGGQGGATIAGDKSGYAGQCGGNFPIGDSYYQSGDWRASDPGGRYSSFIRTYGVWPGNPSGSWVEYRSFYAPYTGNYIITAAGDNNISLYVDDVLAVTANENNAAAPSQVTVALTRGSHRLKFVVYDDDSDSAFAVTISSTNGQLFWDTRTYADVNPPGKDNQYYITGHAEGGAAGGGNGQSGLAVLVIEPIALLSTKINGQWKSISNAYVKVDGDWRTIDEILVKVDDSWKSVSGSGDVSAVNFTGTSSNYGIVSRGFS